jgi:RNA polymerase sigma-70 factor (ECF subfamily)
MVVLIARPSRTDVTKHGFDAAYVERLGAGDPQTEGHFSAYFGELILVKARARRLTQAMAEDVRQETLVRVLRTLRFPGGLRAAECLGAFVNSVCNNVLREGFRDKKRHQPPAEEPAPQPDTVTPSPEARLIAEERRQAVRRVIGAMSPEKSRLLREILLDERGRDEVCREFRVTPEYLRVLLHRAKLEFRALYVERKEGTPAPARTPPAASAGRGGRKDSAGRAPRCQNLSLATDPTRARR